MPYILALFICIGWQASLMGTPRTWPTDPFHTKVSTPHSKTTDILQTQTEETQEAEQPLRLQGILEIENRSRAMINDTILRENDSIGAYRVQKIATRYVLLRHTNGHTFRLEFDSQ